MTTLLRPLPLLLMIASIALGADMLPPLLDLDRAASAQRDCNEITQELVKGGGDDRLFLPTEFADYLKTRGRDPGDPWGTPYRLEHIAGGYGVRSAGPDRKFESTDDLFTQSSR